MKHLYDLLEGVDIDEFWQVIDKLPDVIDGKNHKTNIRRFVDKTGELKRSTKNLVTSDDMQIFHDTSVFIRTIVRAKLHKIKLVERKEARKKELDALRERKRDGSKRTNSRGSTSSKRRREESS